MARIWTSNEKRIAVIIIVFGIVIGYFSLALAGVLPESIDLTETIWGDNAVTDDDNTTQSTTVDTSLIQVTGIPEIVNVSDGGTNTYIIQFRAMEGECGDMWFMMRPISYVTNASVQITGADFGWVIADDGLSARYGGAELIPYETTTLTVTIEGDQYTRPGSVMVFCSSDGDTEANAGLVTIVT